MMSGKFRDLLFRRKQPDLVVAEASRIFEQHSAELLNQAQAFVKNQFENGPSSAQAGSGPTYTDFVCSRRQSLVRKLLEDVQLQEMGEEHGWGATEQKLEGPEGSPNFNFRPEALG